MAYSHRLKIHRDELPALKVDIKEVDKTKACSVCDKTYYTDGSLRYHMRRKHDIRVKKKVQVMKSRRVLLKNGLKKKIRSQSYKLGDATMQFGLGLHMRKVHQENLFEAS